MKTGQTIGYAAIAVLGSIFVVSMIVTQRVPPTSDAEITHAIQTAAHHPKLSRKDEALKAVKLTYQTSKGGFGTILLMNGTITNPTSSVIKDPRITCMLVAPSGTRFGDASATLYERIEPGQTMQLQDLNFGFIHSQAYGGGCKITDLIAHEAPLQEPKATPPPEPKVTPSKPAKPKHAKPAA